MPEPGRRYRWWHVAALVLLASLSWASQEPEEALAPQDPEALPRELDDLEILDEPDVDVEAGYQYLDEGIISDRLQEIMSRSEFERLRVEPEEPEETELPGWLESFLDWLESWLGSGEETSDRSSSWLPGLSGLDFLVYAVVAIALVLLLGFILRAVVGSPSSKKLTTPGASERPVFRADRAPGEVAPGEYWQRALAFGEAADYRKAVREILLAAMSTIERRGLIRFRKGLTNRDYYYAVRGAPRESFDVIAQAFELVYFGRREASVETYHACKQAYERSFLREATA